MKEPGPPGGAREPDTLEDVIGHRFRDRALLGTALSHPSHAYEVDGTRGNERLEFLGDAVLDLVVARLLYEAHPDWREGDLTRTRASLVNTGALAGCARSIGLPERLRLGRTEHQSGGAAKDSILASAFEAVVGAMYLDGGLGDVERLVRRLFGATLEPGARPREADPKTRLQEWSHARREGTPSYRVVEDTGIENDAKRFLVEVRIGDHCLGRGRGRTKRRGERAAAQAALEALGEGPGDAHPPPPQASALERGSR